MEKKPILLLANTGYIVRNLLLGTFAEAIAANYPLCVAVQDPQNPKLRASLEGKPYSLIPFIKAEKKLFSGRLQHLYDWTENITLLKAGAKATPATKMDLRLRGRKHSRLGRTRMSSFVAAGSILHYTQLLGIVEERYLDAIRHAEITMRWHDLLKQIRPGAVVSTTLTLTNIGHLNPDLPAVIAAHDLGIPTGTIIQSWDNLSTKYAILPSWLDRYWTWNQPMSDELIRFYPQIERTHIKIVGSPQFDFHVRDDLLETREEFLSRVGLDPRRPVIMIGTGVPNRLPEEHRLVTELIAELHKSIPHVQVILRFHPKDAGHRWEKDLPLLNSLGVVIQRPLEYGNVDLGEFASLREYYREQLNTIYHSAVIINASSTLTVDAAIIDRPIVCVAYDPVSVPGYPNGYISSFAHSTHYAPLTATGGVLVAESQATCVDAIRAYLADPSLHREGRRRIAQLVVGEVDGKAGERLATEVFELAGGSMCVGL